MNERIPMPEPCKSKEVLASQPACIMRLKHQGEILPKVTGAMDSCRLLQVSHEKELLIERLKYETSLGHRRKKTMPWRSAGFGLRVWRSKKPMLCLHAVTDEDGNLLENEDDSSRLCECWSTIFEARVEGEGHHCRERWEHDRNEFDELLATKKRIRSRSRWGSVKSLQACWRVGLSIPLQCAQTCD